MTLKISLTHSFLTIFISHSFYLQIAAEYRAKGEVPRKFLLDDQGNCVLTQDELKSLIKDSTAAKTRRADTKTHTLQVSFPCPPSEKAREDEGPTNKKRRLEKLTKSKKVRLEQVLPMPHENEVLPAMPVPAVANMQVSKKHGIFLIFLISII